MATVKSEFLNILQSRGFIHQASDLEGLDARLQEAPISAYIGFDCTAPSLHVGSLVQIMMLRWLQKTGHRPVVLFGGGTTRIGDPSGRDESRQLLTDAVIAENMDGISSVFARFLDFGTGATDAVRVNNADWLDSLSYIDMLREVGPHFTVNRMLTFDSVKLRLDREQPLTFLEFNYMILQAYDFRVLRKSHDCVLQMGGSDQWGNIVNGMELIRRMDADSAFGLTTPLLTTADGKKMGKTASGAVWLNEAQLSHYDYWQFWRNTHDADVGRFLRLFTELPLEEIARLEALGGSDLNSAKKILADEATRLCRGDSAAIDAAKTAEETFAKGGAGGGLPTVILANADLASGLGVLSAFVQAGLAKSNGEARRLIKQGGLKVNDAKITDENGTLSTDDMIEGQIKLSAGKKRHALIKTQ